MNLTLHLPPETESRLLEWATLSGKKPETVVLEAIEERLSGQGEPLPQASSLTEFQAWLGAHPASDVSVLDDSRESVYEGRGE